MRPGHIVEHPPLSSAEVKKETVELYFYTPFGPSGPDFWYSLSFIYFFIYPLHLA